MSTTQQSKSSRRKRRVNCPWGWCNEDYKLHRDYCLHSKCEYGISWGHCISRDELFSMFGYDIWERDENDNPIAPLKPNAYVHGKPTKKYYESDDESDDEYTERVEKTQSS